MIDATKRRGRAAFVALGVFLVGGACGDVRPHPTNGGQLADAGGAVADAGPRPVDAPPSRPADAGTGGGLVSPPGGATVMSSAHFSLVGASGDGASASSPSFRLESGATGAAH